MSSTYYSDPQWINQCTKTDLLKSYIQRGWKVFPLAPGTKEPFQGSAGCLDAVCSWEKVKSWLSLSPNCNWGVACGRESNLTISDVDKKTKGWETLKRLVDAYGELRDCLRVKTPSGGFQLYYQWCEWAKSVANPASGIDCRNEGGYALLPPSSVDGVGRYEWMCYHMPLAHCPGWLMRATQKDRYDLISSNGAGDGERNSVLCELTGRMLARGDDPAEVRGYALEWNERCNPPEKESIVLRTVENLIRKEEGKREETNGEANGEATNGEAINGDWTTHPKHVHVEVFDPPETPAEPSQSSETDGTDDKTTVTIKKTKESAATRLTRLAVEKTKVFLSSERIPSAQFRQGTRIVCRPIESKAYKSYLAGLASHHAQPVTNRAISDVILAMTGVANQYRCMETYTRLARIGDEIWLDLCNDQNEVVRITADGYTLENNCPVIFIRPNNAATLPAPVKGGSLEQLRSIINIADEDFPLFVAFLLDALKGIPPYHVAMVSGGHGSAKSWLCIVAKRLIDPVAFAELQIGMKDLKDIVAVAKDNHLMALENISYLPSWLSDALCALATGAGIQCRELYTNADSFVWGGSRPIMINGIPDLAEAADLGSRSMRLLLPHIEKYKDSNELLAKLTEYRPAILGCLFDMIARGLREYGNTPVGSSRMASTERWIMACGLEGFSKRYAEMREETNTIALDSSQVVLGLRHWMQWKDIKDWKGTATDLLMSIRSMLSNDLLHHFPRNANTLSSQLRRVDHLLKQEGILIEKSREGDKRTRFITVKRVD